MDIRHHDERTPDARSPHRQSIALPNAQEGIGNALRAAFNAGNWTTPEDMRKLLEQMN
jgi:hypothetical protein